MECIANFSWGDNTPQYIESCAITMSIIFAISALFFTLAIMYISIRRRYKPRPRFLCSICNENYLIADNSLIECDECEFNICDYCWVQNKNCPNCDSYLHTTNDGFPHS